MPEFMLPLENLCSHSRGANLYLNAEIIHDTSGRYGDSLFMYEIALVLLQEELADPMLSEGAKRELLTAASNCLDRLCVGSFLPAGLTDGVRLRYDWPYYVNEKAEAQKKLNELSPG